MAILDYQLSDAFGEVGERVVTLRYNSVTLAILNVEVDNATKPDDHVLRVAGNAKTTPAHGHVVHDLVPLGLVVALSRLALHPPSFDT